MNAKNVLSDDEIQKFLTWFDPSNFHKSSYNKAARNKLAFLIMVEAGLRIGECVQLHWDDIIFDEKPVLLLKLPANITKTGYARDIPTTQRLQNQIQRFYEMNTPLLYHLDHQWVFYRSGSDKHMSTRHLSRSIKAAAVRSIGRPVSAHCLRHTFATRLLRHTNTRTVQLLLGHSSLQSTQIYTHPNSVDLKEAIDKI